MSKTKVVITPHEVLVRVDNERYAFGIEERSDGVPVKSLEDLSELGKALAELQDRTPIDHGFPSVNKRDAERGWTRFKNGFYVSKTGRYCRLPGHPFKGQLSKKHLESHLKLWNEQYG